MNSLSWRVTLFAAAVLAAACGRPLPPDPGDINVTPDGQFLMTLSLDGVPAGSRLTLTRLPTATPADESTTTVPENEPALTLERPKQEVLFATITSPDGKVVYTQSMAASCARGGSERVLRVPQDFPTIQAGIDAASAGDTVKVAPGTYFEHVRLKRGVCLLGSGAASTVLDGEGRGETLVNMTDAKGSVLAGFTLRGVGQASGCAQPQDPFVCSGNWYAAAVHLDGHSWAEPPDGASVVADGSTWTDPVVSPPALITHNVFTGNQIAVMIYFHGLAIARNNVFVANEHAFIANHFQDRTLIANNVFWENHQVAIGSSAAYLDIINNVIARSQTAVVHQFIQTGRIRCNLFFDNTFVGERVPIGTDGNVVAAPHFRDPGTGDFHLAPGSPGIDSGCFPGAAFDPDGSAQDRGIYGGPLGDWIQG